MGKRSLQSILEEFWSDGEHQFVVKTPDNQEMVKKHKTIITKYFRDKYAPKIATKQEGK